MKKFIFDLQYFANPNTNVTGSILTDDTVTSDTPGTLSIGMKRFYDTALLKNARAELIFSQFAKKEPLPQKKGKSIEFRKWKTLPDALEPLTEGVTPDGNKLGEDRIIADLAQYGDYVTISDVVDMVHVDDTVLGANEELGAQGGSTLDILTRNRIMSGTNVMYAPSVSGSTVTDVSTRVLLDENCLLTSRVINKAATMLKKGKGPKINGKYVGIIHPSVAEDIRNDSAWIEAHKYSAATEIFNGEIGELHGVRFVETTHAPVYRGDDLTDESRTLKVGSYSNKVITLTTDAECQLTSAQATALKGRELAIDGVWYVVASATAYAAGSPATAATITVKDAPATNTPAANDIIYPGEGGKEGKAAYGCFFLSKDSYAEINLEGGGIEMIIKALGSAGAADPLNQRQTIGWKAWHSACILYPERIVRVEVGSSYSSMDEAN